jgi:hypothetical protein
MHHLQAYHRLMQKHVNSVFNLKIQKMIKKCIVMLLYSKKRLYSYKICKYASYRTNGTVAISKY